MSATFTNHFNLAKPATADLDWGPEVDGNFDIIDATMHANREDSFVRVFGGGVITYTASTGEIAFTDTITFARGTSPYLSTIAVTESPLVCSVATRVTYVLLGVNLIANEVISVANSNLFKNQTLVPTSAGAFLFAIRDNVAPTNRIVLFNGQILEDGVAGTLNTGSNVAGGGGSNPMTALGDTIYGGVAGVQTRLPAGTTGQILTLAGGIPSWETLNIPPGPVNPSGISVPIGDLVPADVGKVAMVDVGGITKVYGLSGSVPQIETITVDILSVLEIPSVPAVPTVFGHNDVYFNDHASNDGSPGSWPIMIDGDTIAITMTDDVPIVPKAQVVTVTPDVSLVAVQNFIQTVNGTPYNFLSDATPTAAEVVTGLKLLINADFGAVVTATGTTTLILTADVPGTPFTHAESANLNAVLSVLNLSTPWIGGTTVTFTFKDFTLLSFVEDSANPILLDTGRYHVDFSGRVHVSAQEIRNAAVIKMNAYTSFPPGPTQMFEEAINYPLDYDGGFTYPTQFPGAFGVLVSGKNMPAFGNGITTTYAFSGVPGVDNIIQDIVFRARMHGCRIIYVADGGGLTGIAVTSDFAWVITVHGRTSQPFDLTADEIIALLLPLVDDLGTQVFTKVELVSQITSVIPSPPSPLELFTQTIGGVNYDYTTGITPTVEEVVAGLAALINADSLAPATASGTTALILKSKIPGIPFTHAESLNLAATDDVLIVPKSQVVTVTPDVTLQAVQNFIQTIDGTPYTYLSDVDPTDLEVVAGLTVLINADLGCPATASGTTTLILTAKVRAVAFTYAESPNLTAQEFPGTTGNETQTVQDYTFVASRPIFMLTATQGVAGSPGSPGVLPSTYYLNEPGFSFDPPYIIAGGITGGDIYGYTPGATLALDAQAIMTAMIAARPTETFSRLANVITRTREPGFKFGPTNFNNSPVSGSTILVTQPGANAISAVPILGKVLGMSGAFASIDSSILTYVTASGTINLNQEVTGANGGKVKATDFTPGSIISGIALSDAVDGDLVLISRYTRVVP